MFSTQQYFGFDPRTIPGCQLWLDAADSRTITLNGSTVSTWTDKSTNTFSATQSTPANQPTYNSSSKALVFNGTSTVLSVNGLNMLRNVTGATVFAVRQYANVTDANTIIFAVATGTGTARTIIGQSAGQSRTGGRRLDADSYVYSTHSVTASLTLESFVQDWANASWIVYQQGSTATSTLSGTITAGNSSDTASTGIFIGTTSSGNTQYFNGSLYELIVFSFALSGVQRQQVEGYLAWKWGLQSSLPASHSFKANPTTMRIFQPIDISNCILWLDGADSSQVGVTGANVTAWNDKSGLGNNLTTISATRPTYSPTTGGITFISQNLTFIRGALSGGPYLASNGASTFIVCSVTLNANAQYNPRLLIFGTNGTSSTYFAPQTNFLQDQNTGTTPKFLMYANTSTNPTGLANNVQTYIPTTFSTMGIYENLSSYSGTTLTANTFLNGNTSTFSSRTFTWTVSSPYVTSMAYVCLGNYTNGTAVAGDCFSGDIYEVIVYPRVLTTSERLQIEGYLAAKWKLSSLLPTTNPYRLLRCLPSTPLFVPSFLTGLQLWLDAGDSSSVTYNISTNVVSAWADKSPNALSFTPNAGTSITYSNRRINYPGDAYMRNTTSTISISQNYTFFVICSNNEASGNNIATLYVSSDTGLPGIYQEAPTQPAGTCRHLYRAPPSGGGGVQVTPAITIPIVDQLIEGFRTGTASPYTVGALVNGGASSTISDTQTTALGTCSQVAIGNLGTLGISRQMTGSFAEVILYNRALALFERQQVEGYLLWKWNRQTRLPATHPYYKFRP